YSSALNIFHSRYLLQFWNPLMALVSVAEQGCHVEVWFKGWCWIITLKCSLEKVSWSKRK
ncbi:MAG: hypothetical protein NQU45_08160, partial [Methanothermobacter sp.]|nr:hypothetical protein [Methanothermobacter sp.]